MAAVSFGEKFVVALDNAMVKVANDEFSRLSKGMPTDEWASKVCGALKEMYELSRGSHPDYCDEWVALMYFLWYQPKQVMLSSRAISQIRNINGNGRLLKNADGRLQVYDFGCGALATQFALPLAIIGSNAREEQISEVHIRSYDVSKPLIALGKKLWNRLQVEANREPALQPLVEACKFVKRKASTNDTILIGNTLPGADIWVSAIHTVYRDNIGIVAKHLSQIIKDNPPDIGIISTFEAKGQMLDEVSPFGPVDFRLRDGQTREGIPNQLFPRITNWRRERLSEINRIPPHIANNFLGYDVKGFLGTDVTCAWQPADCRVYSRIETSQ